MVLRPYNNHIQKINGIVLLFHARSIKAAVFMSVCVCVCVCVCVYHEAGLGSNLGENNFNNKTLT